MDNQKHPEVPKAFLPLLRDIVNWWKVSHLTGVVIGGIAASLLGRPRATRDIDTLVMVDMDRVPQLFSDAQNAGFEPRLPDAVEFAKEARVLLLRHKTTGIDVDVTFGALPFEQEVIDRARKFQIDDVEFLLPTPEDLIIMKAIANRPRDINDIEAILDSRPDLDLKRIRDGVHEFASLLEMPEIGINIEKMLTRYIS